HGIGEGTLNGFIRTTEAAVRELEKFVIGEDPRRVNALAKKMLDSVSLDGGHIHRTAIAAIEVACWDILGKSLGVPVYQLLGGRVRDSVLGYANGWYRTERTPEAFLEAARAVIAKGFKAFKIDPFGTAQGFISAAEPDLALAHGSYIAPHQSGGPIATAVCLQLAACVPNFLIQEHFDPFNEPWASDLVTWSPTIDPSNGHLVLPHAPGLGIDLNVEVAR